MRSIYLSAAFSLFIQTAQAQTFPTFEKVAVAGKAQQIDRLVGLDPDCRPIAAPTISIIEGPRQGQVTTSDGRDFPTFPPGNPRSKCNSRKYPSIKIIYTAPAGSIGDDLFALEIVDQFGNPRRMRYHVSIR